MSVGCKIIRDFQRPDPELVELFRGLPVANIDDNMERTAAVESSIVPVGKGQLLGTAFTVQVAQGDNLMFHAAMDMAKPGDVIVIDAGGFTERAIFGELMATYCKVRGIRGIVCDGAKPSCAGKIASAVDAGILGYEMFCQGQQFRGGDGILSKGVENTINNISRLGAVGMKETDKEIIQIMTDC